MPDFTKAKAEYIRGNVSYRELAEKYGVSLSTLMKYGAKEKWAELRKKTSEKTEEKIVETAAKQEAGRADMFNTIADKLLQRILSAVERGDIDTKRGYRDITGALKDLKEIKGLKSEADMREQLARIRNLEKQADADDKSKDKNITVHIDGDDNFSE